MPRLAFPISLILAGSGMALSVPAAAPAELTSAGNDKGRSAVGTSQPITGEMDLARAADGLFYVTAQVNEKPVRFLIDTGASVVMLTRADAAAVGVDLGRDSFRSQMRTANGSASMAWTKLRGVRVAGREVGEIDAAVPERGLPVSLLGQNLLTKLGPVTIDGDRLHVHGRPPSAVPPSL